MRKKSKNTKQKMEKMVEENIRLDSEAATEKETVARNSVIIAVLLTFTKAIVGYLTNSLGIISEALHSGLDLIAAIVTWFAVKISGKPADEEHPYGHGKIESVSAMIEILLLVLTAYWIVLESIEKLKGQGEKMVVNFWSFAVMILSIILNVWRSRVLYKTAKQYNSQALEADALHFLADVVSSVVVIVGLAFAPWFPAADPISAIGVAIIIAYACIDLGKEAMNILLDKAPEGMTEDIRQAALNVPNVLGIKDLRVRTAGGQAEFADLSVEISADLPFKDAHGISHQVEKAIRSKYPNCSTQIHIEPGHSVAEDLFAKIRRTALYQKGIVNLHNLQLLEEEGFYSATLHLEVDEKMTLSEAHVISSHLEGEIRKIDPKIRRVITHLEPACSSNCRMYDVTEQQKNFVEEVREIIEKTTSLKDFHNFKILSDGNKFSLEMHIRADGTTPISDAHKLSGELEGNIRRKLPQFSTVMIHLEPLK